MPDPETGHDEEQQPAESSIDYAQMLAEAQAEVSTAPESVKPKAPLPNGWTYLIHGTDTGRWDVGEERVEITGSGLSCITSEDAARDAYDTTGSYAKPRTQGAQPVEIRIPFYREDLSTRRGAGEDVRDLKSRLDPDTLALITKYHSDRHAKVPRHETLVRLGQEQSENGQIIEYMIPASVADQYRASVKQELGEELGTP